MILLTLTFKQKAYHLNENSIQFLVALIKTTQKETKGKKVLWGKMIFNISWGVNDSFAISSYHAKATSVPATPETHLFEFLVVSCYLWLQGWTFWTRDYILRIGFCSKNF